MNKRLIMIIVILSITIITLSLFVNKNKNFQNKSEEILNIISNEYHGDISIKKIKSSLYKMDSFLVEINKKTNGYDDNKLKEYYYKNENKIKEIGILNESEFIEIANKVNGINYDKNAAYIRTYAKNYTENGNHAVFLVGFIYNEEKNIDLNLNIKLKNHFSGSDIYFTRRVIDQYGE